MAENSKGKKKSERFLYSAGDYLLPMETNGKNTPAILGKYAGNPKKINQAKWKKGTKNESNKISCVDVILPKKNDIVIRKQSNK